MAAGDTRKALAMACASRPSTARSISGARTFSGRAGWAQTNISRSRASGTASAAGAAASPSPSNNAVTAGSSVSRVWRAWCSRRCLAAAISQASGESGSPCAGQVRRAAAKASPRASSAAARSRHCQASSATSRP